MLKLELIVVHLSDPYKLILVLFTSDVRLIGGVIIVSRLGPDGLIGLSTVFGPNH